MWNPTYLSRFSLRVGIIRIAIVLFVLIGFGRTTDRASALPAAQTPAMPCEDTDRSLCVYTSGTEPVSGSNDAYGYPWGPQPAPNPNPRPHPGPIWHLGPDGLELVVAFPSDVALDTIARITVYGPSAAPLKLLPVDTLEIPVQAAATVTATIFLDPATAPGSYLIDITGPFASVQQDFVILPAGEESADLQKYFRVTDFLRYRAGPSTASPIDAILPVDSFVKTVGYPRSADDGSLWYPAVSSFRPNRIYWVNDVGLDPADANPSEELKTAMDTSLTAYIDRNRQQLPEPISNCLEGNEDGDRCLTIVEATP